MNKKSQGDTIWVVVAIVLALLVVGFGAYLVYKSYLLGDQLNIDTLAESTCKAQGEALKLQGKTFEDKDNDLRPDYLCDTCVPGNNDDDKDGDGVPTACDTDDTDPTRGFCSGKDKEDCSKSKCCTRTNTKCGPSEKGTIKNHGTESKPKYYCEISS